jgi:hypothetical protein
MMHQIEVIHHEFQQQLSSELDKLSNMSTREYHILHVKDEEDGTPIWCILIV